MTDPDDNDRQQDRQITEAVQLPLHLLKRRVADRLNVRNGSKANISRNLLATGKRWLRVDPQQGILRCSTAEKF
jgi:hypothetical protein